MAGTDKIMDTPQTQADESNGTVNKDEVSPRNSKINGTDTGEEVAKEKNKVKSTKKKARIKNEGNIDDKSFELLLYN